MNTFDNSVYVVTVDGSVTISGVLDGFTITAARPDEVEGFGGSGMWIDGGAPTLSRLIFTANRKVGLRANGGSPTLTDCQFLSNGVGGASLSGNFTCRNCVFRSNTGPGVSVSGRLTLVNAIIAKNTGAGASVGIGKATFDNCTLAHNGDFGLRITSRTLTTLHNTIIWGNTLGGIYERRLPEPLETTPQAESSTSISYCDVQDGVRSGPGNVSADPLFLSPPGDLRPGVGSPVVDAGHNASVPPGVATDIDGLPRFMNDPSTPDTGVGTPPIVDMGAYERQPHLVVSAPGNLDLCAGEDAVSSVSAFGMPPFGYQWRRDAVPLVDGGRILGTATATLTISDAIPDDSGTYDVVVADGDGHSITSAEAALVVFSPLEPPTITAPFSVGVGSMGNAASVPESSGTTWDWKLSLGTITGGHGTDQIAFAAGPAGATMLLWVSAANAGCASAYSSTAVQVDFLDVPPDDLFHDYVIAVAREGITAGCGDGNYCRNDPLTRGQMAVLILKAEHGATYEPPPCASVFGDVPCPSPQADWIEQLYAEQISGGCSSSPLLYCPDASVTRQQMAVFLLKAEHGSAYVPPDCSSRFADVACPSLFADWIEQLYAENVTGGCSVVPLLYCPGKPNTRGQMAVFLTKTFHLPLP